jgi:ubiquinone biosynthesis protein
VPFWIVVAIGSGILWVVGSLLLLATNPRGGVRAFIVEVLVNVLALMATLFVLSLIRLPGTGPDGVSGDQPLLSLSGGLITVGVLFAIINAVVRPVLFTLFGRLILRSLGIAVVAVNAVMFWLVAELSGALGQPWVVPDPRLLWLVVDSIVFTVALSVLSAFLGLDRPHLEADSKSRAWRFVERLPLQRRNALVESIRLQEVYDTLSRYGLEIVVGGTALAPVRRLGDRMMGRSSAELEALSSPAKVRVMLQQLGPTFVKVGQMAGSRADALPEDWREELDKLQSTVPPFPWDQARAIIAEELGADPEELFASIDPKPLGAASLAQVHRATMHDGHEVVVKIQRPDVRAKVRADLGVLQELAAVAESRLELARHVGAVGLAKEFADGVLEELDYETEAYHARRLADVVADIPGVGVPAVYPALSSDRVLTMDFVPGVKATHADRLDPAIDREHVARAFMRSIVKQIMIEGFFHADPHPGNVMIDPASGKITFLDLGLVGELRREQRFDLIALLWALRMKDAGALATVSLRLCVATGPIDEGAYRADVDRLFNQYSIYGSASFSRMMSRLFATLRGHGLRMRRELTLAVKSITQAEELLRSIAPGLSLVETATEEAEVQLRAELTPDRVAELMRGQLGAVMQSVLETANDRRADIGAIVLDAISRGRLGGPPAPDPADLRPIAERLDRLGERMERLGRNVAVAIGAAGLAIALGIVLVGIIILGPGADIDPSLFLVGAATAVTLAMLGYSVYRHRSIGP